MPRPEDRPLEIEPGGEEDEEEEEDEPPPPAPAPKPRIRRLGAARFDRRSNEADLVWDQLVQWLPSQHLSERDVSIVIKRIKPPSPQGGPLPMGRSFGGEAVVGNADDTPGSALIQYILRYIHLASGIRTDATYDVYFTRKSTGATFATGRLNLPTPEEAINLMTAGEQAHQTQGVGQPTRVFQQHPAPNPAYQTQPNPQPQPGYVPQPQQGYGSPPYGAPPPQPPQQMWDMMSSMMNELMSAAREGRKPVMPEAGVAAPVTQAELEDRVAAKVLLGLQRAGVFPAAPPAPAPVATAPAAPPPAPAPADSSFEGLLKRSVSGIFETVLKSTMASIEGNVKTAMGVGAVPEEVAEVPAPHKPEDDLPFSVAPVGASWLDGRPMQVAVSKDEDKSIDWMATAMANPVIAEKAMDLANGLGGALKEFLQSRTPGAAPPAQVVKQIPPGAVRADVAAPPPPPSGDGWEAPR
jgi:hypothetical protein